MLFFSRKDESLTCTNLSEETNVTFASSDLNNRMRKSMKAFESCSGANKYRGNRITFFE